MVTALSTCLWYTSQAITATDTRMSKPFDPDICNVFGAFLALMVFKLSTTLNDSALASFLETSNGQA